ncbi:RDD family protein [Peribacillus saganii]|uniref:RDD family protein n=1 Tax=Peribacillus saganii TaxID=2303992 RepID=A0A372LS73_9BACI|nr:RDD family protein [Peribacillus saganii]RFU71049.1 RDD family protein [Peribacillus saganii]
MYNNRPAGFWIRLGSIVIDGLLFLPIYLIFLFMGVSDTNTELVVNSINFLYFLIVPVLWAGFTVGKRAVGIRIVRIDGGKVTIWTTVKRYILASLIYVVTLGLGVLVSAFMIGLRQDKRSIHDFVAGTEIVHISK